MQSDIQPVSGRGDPPGTASGSRPVKWGNGPAGGDKPEERVK